MAGGAWKRMAGYLMELVGPGEVGQSEGVDGGEGGEERDEEGMKKPRAVIGIPYSTDPAESTGRAKRRSALRE